MTKRDQIIEATIRLFSEDGIGVPTAKIAKEAGVSNGTLFNNFTTKQDLLESVYFFIKEKTAADIMADFDEDTNIKENLKKLWEAFIRWSLAHPTRLAVIELLLSSRLLSPEILAKGEDLFSPSINALKNAISDGEIKKIPLPLLTEMANAQLYAVTRHIRQNALSSEQITDLIDLSFDVFWTGSSTPSS